MASRKQYYKMIKDIFRDCNCISEADCAKGECPLYTKEKKCFVNSSIFIEENWLGLDMERKV